MGVCLACGGRDVCADCVRVLAAYVSPKKTGGRVGALEVEGVEEPTLPGLDAVCASYCDPQSEALCDSHSG